MVCHTIHSQEMDIILFAALMDMMDQSGTDSFRGKEGHPVFGCPDQMDVDLCEWHKSSRLIIPKNREIPTISPTESYEYLFFWKIIIKILFVRWSIFRRKKHCAVKIAMSMHVEYHS